MKLVKKITNNENYLNIVLITLMFIFSRAFGAIFGVDNTFLGIAIVFATLILRKPDIQLSNKGFVVSTMAIYLISSIAPYLIKSNILMLFVNFVGVFAIGYLYSTNKDSKSYLPFTFMYIIIANTVPNTQALLLSRTCAVVLGTLLISIAYCISDKKVSKSKSKISSVNDFLEELPKNSVRFNFALRTAIAISVATCIGNIIGGSIGLWVSLIATVLIKPIVDEQYSLLKSKAINGMILTLILAAFCFINTSLEVTIIVLIIATCLYGTCDKSSKTTTNDLDVLLLSVSVVAILTAPIESVPTKAIMVLVGFALTLLINKFYYKKRLLPANTKPVSKIEAVRNSNVNSKKHNKRKKNKSKKKR